MKKLLVVTALIVAAMSCNSDGSITKLDLCLSIVDYFCGKVDSYDCGYATCKSDYSKDCKDTFTGDCAATPNDIFMFQDEIPSGWIDSKTSCAGLQSVESSIETEVMNMAAGPCASGNSSGSKTNGQYCDDLLGELCKKVVSLNCLSVDQATCVSGLYDSGTMAVTATYTCTSSSDSSTPDDTLKSAFETAISQAGAVTTCSEMGF